MKILPFKSSNQASLGVELEFQIINPHTFDLISRAKDLITEIKGSHFRKLIKPEVTQSMIEFNSSVHTNATNLLIELIEMRNFLLELGSQFNVLFSGGGTHPFQKWELQKIFPTKRFKTLARQFRYLSKRSTVFGMHIHIGCANSEDALYLTHALGRFVPQFIALSASSPYYQGVDTGFDSSRMTIFTSFPLCGTIPYLTTWQEFSTYFYKLRKIGIVETMKDFYWDIRPKPEFGTVELRICDTPLTFKRVVMIAAYAQTLARYLLDHKTTYPLRDLYHLYNYNRFQASRYGLKGEIIEPVNFERISIKDDILNTINLIDKYSDLLNNKDLISQLNASLNQAVNNAFELRRVFKDTGSLTKVVQEQCIQWAKENG